ncbi:hypothetical protein KJ707_00175 [Patescibacteria group bacterium]|nr:hypothetical protein [Patescibacteria group bacterium]
MESNKQKLISPIIQINFGGLINLLSVIFLLVGIYSMTRVIVNLKFFDKYPMTGVLYFNFYGVSPYYQKEEDCVYPITYIDDKGTARKPSQEEQDSEKNSQDRCLNDVKSNRDNAKVNDINTSIFFIFLGSGILITKKFLYKHE